MWIYNRLIIRKKGKTEEFVIRRIRCGESKETSTLQLLPLQKLLKANQDFIHNKDIFDEMAMTFSISTIINEYESSGRCAGIVTTACSF